eukprot:TRINITY_DN78920_c0_g1_i4.p1 TRINITY_DN78920_c0_g1~~TRINITY_DN78920_c0_g1_i4.p1  ORF type:complete len:318 (-),score=11.09 TRINITY_DN78920_c0_g1_i4:272-1225(-)
MLLYPETWQIKPTCCNHHVIVCKSQHIKKRFNGILTRAQETQQVAEKEVGQLEQYFSRLVKLEPNNDAIVRIQVEEQVSLLQRIKVTRIEDFKLLALMAGLTLEATTFDIFYEDSLHLFAPIDTSVHLWVQSNCCEAILIFADKVISDIPIGIGAIGCMYCIGKLLMSGKASCYKNLALLAPYFVLGFGYFDGHLQMGGLACNTLKTFFQRTRPSEYLHSFAYPSGHSSTATFLVGIFLLVLLPMITANQTQNKTMDFIYNNRYRLWISAWAITGCSRLVADVHWFSDVCAGFLLGAFLVFMGKSTIDDFGDDSNFR